MLISIGRKISLLPKARFVLVTAQTTTNVRKGLQLLGYRNRGVVCQRNIRSDHRRLLETRNVFEKKLKQIFTILTPPPSPSKYKRRYWIQYRYFGWNFKKKMSQHFSSYFLPTVKSKRIWYPDRSVREPSNAWKLRSNRIRITIFDIRLRYRQTHKWIV